VTAAFAYINRVNSSTNVATFTFYTPWLQSNYSLYPIGISAFDGIVSELEAATTLYAAERVFAAQGAGIVLQGPHIENPGTCMTLFDGTDVWGGQVSNEIDDPYFNTDISLSNSANSLAQTYCQQSFSFIYMEGNTDSGGPQSLALVGGNWNAAVNPINFDVSPTSRLSGKQLGLGSINTRVLDGGGSIGFPYGNSYYQVASALATPARGAGIWDNDYFLPLAMRESPLLTAGEITTEFCGYEPCPWTTPNLSTTLYGMVAGISGASVTGTIDNGSATGTPSGNIMTVSSVSSGMFGPGASVSGASVTAGTTIARQLTGTTGGAGTYFVNPSQGVASETLTTRMGLGSYPPIACRTVFKSVDWNTPAITPPSTTGGGIFKRSASCPGYSYGQNLTTATLGATTNAVVTGTIANGSGGSGNILNVSAVTSGTLHVGDSLTGTGVPTGEHIIQQSSGTAGGIGTYLVSENTNIASETLTDPVAAWAYEAGSDVLYLDATTMQWMFPGLGISINNGSGAQPYIVTGVYPYLGYVTVIWAANNAGAGLQGSGINGCTSGCTIGQAPFAWTAY
jgi:hypothetical protein